MKILLAILLSLVTYCIADEDKFWHPLQFPNPVIDFEECGDQGTSSHVCDPMGYISNSDVNQLDYLITGARDETECMCSQRYCGDVVQTRGVKIGISIVNKMDPSLLDENEQKYALQARLNGAAHFAQELDREWKLGSCGDTILIFYSVNDHVLYTHIGAATAEKLTNADIAEISMKHRHLFSSKKYFDGFANIINDFKAVIKGDYEREIKTVERPADPQAAALRDGASMTSYQVLTTVLMLVVCLVAHF